MDELNISYPSSSNLNNNSNLESNQSKSAAEILYPDHPNYANTTENETDYEETTGVPEQYNFTLPEGTTLDEGIHGEFQTIARELNLSNKQAQKLMDLEMKYISQRDTQRNGENEKAYYNKLNDMKAETEKKYSKEERAFAVKAIDQIAGPEKAKEFRKFLNNDPVGQLVGMSPVIMDFFIMAGKKLSNSGANPTGAKSLEELYSKSLHRNYQFPNSPNLK